MMSDAIASIPTMGAHNAALPASTARIIAGGSWKHQRVVMLLPAAKTVSTKCAMTWLALQRPVNQAFYPVGMVGLEVGEAYSKAIEGILQDPTLSKAEYILTLEHDNMPPPDGLLRLLARMEEFPQYACIGGLYWTKGPMGVPQIWGDASDPACNFRPQPPDPKGGLVECCGTGMGFNLWRMEMFRDKRLRKPWFVTGPGGTQDLYFWSDARKYGYRCAVDCSVLVGHFDLEGDFTW